MIVCSEANNSCYSFDGVCDEPNICDDGTDAFDCGRCDDVNNLQDAAGGSRCGATFTPLAPVLLVLVRRQRRQGLSVKQSR